MLNINRALVNDLLLRALTGLNRKAFDELCEVFKVVYQESIESDTKLRKRARGGGRKARLSSIEFKLFFILFYFKCYPTLNMHMRGLSGTTQSQRFIGIVCLISTIVSSQSHWSICPVDGQTNDSLLAAKYPRFETSTDPHH
jgi:hypothetical protein